MGIIIMKAPAFQFYVKDWLSDPQLKMASFATKGIWIDMICYMWSSPEPGKIVGTESEIAKMLGATEGEIKTFLSDAERLSFCDVTRASRDSHSIVTVINRRMNRTWKDKESARLRQAKSRGFDGLSPDCHENVQEGTPKRGVVAVGDIYFKEKNKYLDCVFLTSEEHQKLIIKNGQFFTDKAISILNNYLMSKGKDPYKSHYHTLIGWPMERAKEKYEKKQDTSSPYDTCKRCGAEYRKGETAIIDGVPCCPKCPEVRNQESSNYSDLIKKIGRKI
jgi:hypothetical protein